MAKSITPGTIRKALWSINDPELNISIVDLGLVYTISIDAKKQVKVIMTLTTIGCPLFSLIEQEVRAKIQELGIPANHIHIDLTFDPPWTVDRMSEAARAMLGI